MCHDKGQIDIILVLYVFRPELAAWNLIVSDGRVDWSSTLPGIEQPNEAHAPVLNKNIAYEQTRVPRHNEHTTTIVTTAIAMKNIEPSHEYAEVLL